MEREKKKKEKKKGIETGLLQNSGQKKAIAWKGRTQLQP
jgi:hypothetical protein